MVLRTLRKYQVFQKLKTLFIFNGNLWMLFSFDAKAIFFNLFEVWNPSVGTTYVLKHGFKICYSMQVYLVKNRFGLKVLFVFSSGICYGMWLTKNEQKVKHMSQFELKEGNLNVKPWLTFIFKSL